MAKKALVTGGAGFIGSHLVDRLLSENWNVCLVDDLSGGHREFVNPQLHTDNVILEDFASSRVLDRVRSGQYDYVFHLAAVPRVSYSVDHPLESHDTNVTKTLQLLDAAKGNVKRFVFASSSSVYGGADILPTSELYPKSPKSPYALQKSIVEDYLKQYWMHYGLDSVALRFFNVFGPRQLGGSPYSTAVSSWLTSIKRGISMRSDGDGSQTRDVCYVENVTDACFRAAIHSASLEAACFNVACGERISNAEILKKLVERYPESTWHDAPWRAGDVMHTQADLTYINQKLGYAPLFKFWEGLEKTIEWYDTNWETVKNYEVKRC